MIMRYGSVWVKSTEGCYLDMLYIVSVLVLFGKAMFGKARGIARFIQVITFHRIIRVPHPGDKVIEMLQIYAYNHKLHISPACPFVNIQTRPQTAILHDTATETSWLPSNPKAPSCMCTRPPCSARSRA